ncbi:MAG: hypothetical protein ABWY58_15540 [Aeromicrobium sp.]
MRIRALLTVVALGASALLVPAPAEAAARVSVTNDQGSAAVDPTYATTLKVSGTGFQSIKGGHGGIYVFFGTKVPGGYLYVPDSETKGNQGFQKFVAFPGSDTAESANGGTIKADGTWASSLVVPGATFKAVDRDGKAQTVDCRTVTCGVITVGAHGVKNARNETFTPVSIADLYTGRPSSKRTSKPSSSATPAAPAASSATAGAPAAPAASTPPPAAGAPAAAPTQTPVLTVEKSTAVAGRALSFQAVGLTAGDQVVVSLDDGVAAVGPLSVGPNGQVAGILQLPIDLPAGTHTLAVTGTTKPPAVNFPVAAPVDAADAAADTGNTPWAPIVFTGLALVALIGAVVFSVVTIRSTRRRTAADAI